MNPRFWLTRVYLCLSVAATVALTVPVGTIATTFLLWFCAIGLLDTIGHDLMGRRECLFKKLRRFRFLWLMCLATGLTALTLENARWGSMDWEVLRYALDAVLALVLAALDIQVRRAAP